MSMLVELIDRYATEETTIEYEIERLRANLEDAEARLAEVRVVRAALESGAGDLSPEVLKRSAERAERAAARREAPAPFISAMPTPEPAPYAPRTRGRKPQVRVPAPRPKGRRKPVTARSLHEMGIVDAAIHLAQQRGAVEADAGQILEWFNEASYVSPGGATPTRNSIYVSLNREFTEGEKRNRQRITRPERGKFVFHFDEDED